MLRKIEDDSEVWFVASPKNLDLAMQAGARRQRRLALQLCH
jgi:hypothetical protein